MARDEEHRNDSDRPVEDVAETVTRRSFLRKGANALGEVVVIAAVSNAARAEAGTAGRTAKPPQKKSSFVDLLRVPDGMTAYGCFEKTLPGTRISLHRSGEQWRGGQIAIDSNVERDTLVLTLSAPSTPIVAVHVRWEAEMAPGLRVLGDAWERSYGELGWRNLIPERVMPWYFATHDSVSCDSYGVKTDARALCFWQLDQQGVSLWMNLANGGNGVELGERQLRMAAVVARRGEAGESAIEAVAGLCRRMCARTSRRVTPIYGANDWCYSYGRSTAQTILRDTEFTAELSPSGGVRPFSVIDGGWSNGTPAWPDMAKLAAEIKQRTARPGIWIRPLEAPIQKTDGLLLPNARFGDRQERGRELAYDPTVPEAQERISAKLRELAGWKYEMVKHDFTTYDLLGQWGFEMGPQPTVPGWSLHDRSRTNAEVIAELYALIRDAVGDGMLLDGCNTIGHLGQGIFDLQRTGDDTSGHQWERTRRMGVNTATFRLPQHGTFFTLDADVVGITDAVPWELNRQWLDLLARSGTVTLVSAGPPAHGQEQRKALREAFKVAALGGVAAKPVDWMETSASERWRSGAQATSEADRSEQERSYDWSGKSGASPFLSS